MTRPSEVDPLETGQALHVEGAMSQDLLVLRGGTFDDYPMCQYGIHTGLGLPSTCATCGGDWPCMTAKITGKHEWEPTDDMRARYGRAMNIPLGGGNPEYIDKCLRALHREELL